MQRIAVTLGVLALLVSSESTAQRPPAPVEVVNLPAVQPVSGEVEVTNLPEVQPVEVTNTPEVQDVFVTNSPTSSQPARFQLVGTTSATFEGDRGVLRFTLACQGQFGAGSRMCESREVLETTDVPTGLSESWVRPTFAGFAGANNFLLLDASGITEEPVTMSCDGWRSNESSRRGLTVSPFGQFESRLCNSPVGVACCALVP